ncbi:hypothetical protein HHI36_015567 [Cryptolaemus montrouzieri]|uniref:Uncharacterized protein n=1 Tax=Cryptolaemus montrouzieri TaxID=559131 RepID=A0ABD2N606_9CUCU
MQGISDKFNQLECFLATSKAPDVFCITESWLDQLECSALSLEGWSTASSFGRTQHRRGVENLSAGVVGCDFSDHRIQQAQMVIPVTVPGVLSEECRPLTEKGFFDMHNNLQNQNYDFLGTEHVDVHEAFRAFQQSFVDCFRTAFPKRRLRGKIRDAGLKWLTEELRNMRDQVTLVNELFFLYGSAELKALRNKLRLKYRLSIKNAKIRAYDKMIENSANPVKSMWNLINKRRTTSDSVKPRLNSGEFKEYFTSVPHTLSVRKTMVSYSGGMFLRICISGLQK